MRWTYTSKLDLMQIFHYIAKDSVYYAKKVVNDIIDKADYLADFPNMGRIIEEIDDDNLRSIAERVEALNGHFLVRTHSGFETFITIPKEAARA